eukprot:gene4547-4799_t
MVRDRFQFQKYFLKLQPFYDPDVSGSSWSTSLFKVYGVLFRAPGVPVSAEATVAASLVVNGLFVFGMFVFALLIGMISDEIKQQVHALRTGDVTLQLRGHVLVLNWSSITPALLRQLGHAQQNPLSVLFKKPVVVLAERSKDEMDAAVRNLKGLSLDLVVRSGRPSRQADLQRVAAASAGTVLLLQPEPVGCEAAAEALKVATLISLHCLQDQGGSRASQDRSPPNHSWRQASGLGVLLAATRLHSLHASVKWRAAAAPDAAKHDAATTATAVRCSSSSGARENSSSHGGTRAPRAIRVVVQMPDMPQQNDLVGFLQSSTAFSSHIQGARLLSSRMLDRLIAHTALQPGTATVFREVMRPGSDAAQLSWCEIGPALAGTRFRDAPAKFPDDAVVGVLTVGADGRLLLNPNDTLQLQLGDRLVGLTRRSERQLVQTADQVALATGNRLAYGCALRRVEASAAELQQMSDAMTPIVAGKHHPGRRLLFRPMSRTSSISSHRLRTPVSSSRINSTAAAVSDSWSNGLPGKSPKKIIVLGWQGAAVQQLLTLLQDAAPDGSCITCLDKGSAEEVRATGGPLAADAACNSASAQQQQPLKEGRCSEVQPDMQQQQRCKVQQLLVAEPSSMQALVAAGISQADAVVIGGCLTASPSEADAMVVATLLAIEQALLTEQHAAQGGLSPALHVVAVLSSYTMRRSLQHFLAGMLMRHFSYEILVLDEYAGAMLVQVAQDPTSAMALDQLLVHPHGPGSGLCIWPASYLGFSCGLPTSFCSVRKAARRVVVRASAALRDPSKRIVITGIGCCTVFGNDPDKFYEKLLEGVSGVGKIDRFNADDFPTRFAAQIRNFDDEG